jgi:hypothetical protein
MTNIGLKHRIDLLLYLHLLFIYCTIYCSSIVHLQTMADTLLLYLERPFTYNDGIDIWWTNNELKPSPFDLLAIK